MVIYIDVLLFTNILINYCILSLTQKFTNISSKEFRLILSAFLSSFFSLVVLIGDISNFLSLIIKMCCAIFMCLVAFKIRNVSVLIKCVCVNFCISVIFCGTMILVHNFSNSKNLAIINDTVYFQIDPIKLITITVFIYLIIILVQRLLKHDIINTIVNLQITFKDIELKCIGKIDTACSVTEPFSGSPVIIVEKAVLNQNIETNRIIPYRALGTQGILKGFKADKINIDKKVIDKDVYIGIYDGLIDPQFKAIINHNIVR